MRLRLSPVPSRSIRWRPVRCAALVLTAVGGLVVPVAAQDAVAAQAPAVARHTPAVTSPSPGVYRFSALASSFPVDWRGNGHGRGMSQYGAYGAAEDGLTAAQILRFYYPHTTPVVMHGQRIRVKISEAAAWTTIWASAPGLQVVGRGPLPSGYAFFRFAPDGNGLAVGGQKYTASGRLGRWHRIMSGLPAQAQFYSTRHIIRLLFGDGSSTRYRGRIAAVRSGSGEITVNNVGLDGYVKGVVSKEISPSWPAAAVGAQAVAARSYAMASQQASSGDDYDICDTDYCQVYGGMTHLGANGTKVWRCDDSVVIGNQDEVLTYDGSPIWAQYSASNGGATVDGGQPYLVGQPDPYDSAKLSHDPYLNQSRTVSASAFAASFGLARVSTVTVKRRTGYGPWHGRIVAATVTGRTSGGATKTVRTDGFGLGDAAGVWTDYLRFG